MIVAESVGFAATHSLTEILRGVPGFEVSHGSQDFVSKADVGKAYQTPQDFLNSMRDAEAAGQQAVAIHTLYPPQVMKPLCDAADIPYWLIVRNPRRQVASCYSWISNKVLSGNAIDFIQVLKVSLENLNRLGIPASFPNALFYFAINHVLTYNFVALRLGATPRKMEELISDEDTFRTAFGVPREADLPHFAGDEVHAWAHSSRERIAAIEPPEIERITSAYRLVIGSSTYRIEDLEHTLGYPGP